MRLQAVKAKDGVVLKLAPRASTAAIDSPAARSSSTGRASCLLVTNEISASTLGITAPILVTIQTSSTTQNAST